MGIFKKKSCCSGSTEAELSNDSPVKILGGGCDKCNKLEANTLEALKALCMDTTVDHVRDFAQIAAYGVMTTPALVYNKKVLSLGRVPNTQEIINLLKKEL